MRLSILGKDLVESIHVDSLSILEDIGVFIDNSNALKILDDYGCNVDYERKVARINSSLVDECIKATPKVFKLHASRGGGCFTVGDDNTYFNPGSAAIYVYDYDRNDIRKPLTRDLAEFVFIADALDSMVFQSTAIVASDVPNEIYDSWRLFVVLMNSSKPIITGAFSDKGVYEMSRMISIVKGEDMKREPIAVFDVCPSPPLKWSYITSQNIIDCAKLGLPLEIIPMPSPGSTGPVTIYGSLVQHNAEFLAGLVLAQCVRRGSIVVYGGSPCSFDMRYGTVSICGVEALALTLSYVDIAKYYGLPCHAYMAISDSKVIDYQAGFEVGVGAFLAVLKGVNIVSGPGMMENESVQSLEKLVIDAEICSMALRFRELLEIERDSEAVDVLREVGFKADFLRKTHTLKWFRKTIYHPSNIIDRLSREAWIRGGKKDIISRARERILEIHRRHEVKPLEKDIEKELLGYARNLLIKHEVDSIKADKLLSEARFKQ